MNEFRQQLKQYKVIGRKLATEKEPNPPLFRMTIFAPDHVVAKSRFWYFIRQLKKLKKASGEIVDIQEVVERKPARRVKNFGIWLRYDSRTGTVNMYREYRELTVREAVTACYRDMAGQHRARATSIQIIRVEEIQGKDSKRPHVKQFINSQIRFPHPIRFVKNPKGPVFSTRRPTARII